ncbi:MAG TPA: short-chain fatty acyl-CoA regulator family protein [Anaeromyxobacteraceae bacterium]|nr:short-chain fatty acyl-CoA regulator family protein [Anaeromyxobacteraceae bacterium]
MATRESSLLGAKVRALRRQRNMSQVQLAERLAISASYLNLIEHNRRAMPAPLLIKIAEIFDVDLRALSAEHDARTVADLMEVFGDPIFEQDDVTTAEVRDLAAHAPTAARGVLKLYHAFRESREAADNLAMKLSGRGDLTGVDASRLPTEEVSDLVQRHMNHFPEMEEGAEALWREAQLGGDDMQQRLEHRLERDHGIQVQMQRPADMGDAVRRFDPEKRILHLSEVLRRGSRNFQLAYQIGLERQAAALDRYASDPQLTSDSARALTRVVLANYFASAVLMPYAPFAEAARQERYDIDLLGHRFRTSFEQVCHRLTALRRPGAEGVPFHFVRVDLAGNISKRFSASGLRFARFSGACPRWTLFQCFLTPGMFRTQLSQMPDGTSYFWVARTVQKEGGGYHAPRTLLAVAIGCEVSHARKLVYADGVDLDSREAVVPVGLTCRLCERTDCEQRAFPPIQHPLKVQENVRGVSFFAPVGER